ESVGFQKIAKNAMREVRNVGCPGTSSGSAGERGATTQALNQPHRHGLIHPKGERPIAPRATNHIYDQDSRGRPILLRQLSPGTGPALRPSPRPPRRSVG